MELAKIKVQLLVVLKLVYNFNLELTELAPGILSQLGPNAISSLQKMAAAYQQQAAAAGLSLDELAKLAVAKANGSQDEDIPELVKNFETAEINAN